MRKLLIASLVSGLFGSVAYACTDEDLSVSGVASRNTSVGDVMSSIPCAPTSTTTYKDAIGREFTLYTWAGKTKSIIVQAYEGRVFKSTGHNLSSYSTSIVPPDVTYNTNTNILNIPVLTVTGADGNVSTYYDAVVSLSQNGTYAIISKNDKPLGGTNYNLNGYTPSNLNEATGQLTVPNLVDGGGLASFSAVLKSDGTWTDTSESITVVSNTAVTTIAVPNPSFDVVTSILTLPVLRKATNEGENIYYNAKVYLAANGQYSIVSMDQSLAAGVVYDMASAVVASLGLDRLLTVPNLANGGGTIAFQAKLNSNGTWDDLSAVVGTIPNSRSVSAAVAAPSPSFDTTTSVMTIPILKVTATNGSISTNYNARIYLAANGQYAILGMDSTLPAGVAYDLAAETASSLSGGLLTVPNLSTGGGSVAFQAKLNDDGTWVDTSAVIGAIPSTTGVINPAVVGTESYAGSFPGFSTDAVIKVNGVYYKNANSACEIPNWVDAMVEDPAGGGGKIKTIPDNPELTVYQVGSAYYLGVQGWNKTCQVSIVGN